MKPIDFVTHIEHYNKPFGEQMEAITTQSLVITDGKNDYKILSYYFHKGRMILDIEKIKKK